MPKWIQGFLITTILIVVILGGTFAAVGSMVAMRAAMQQAPTERPAPLVDVLALEPQSVTFKVDSQGTVIPVTQTTLSAEVAGTVVDLSKRFEAGGTFRPGQMLMRIDPTNYEVAVARAEATLSQRQVEYDGAKKLREQGYRAEAELLSAKAALESARADLVRAQRDLERTRIVVPYAGLVRSRDAQLGDYVAPGSRLGEVFATDRFEVRLPLPDADLAFVDLPTSGEAVDSRVAPKVTLSGRYRGQDAQWQGYIMRTEGVVDERTRMVFAVASITDPYQLGETATQSQPLPAGTFVEASIDGITLDDVVKIPRTLIRGNNQVVFVDAESQLRLRDLDFLRTDSQYAYVDASQLSEDRVVLTVLETPLSGMVVRVAGEEESGTGMGSAAGGQ